MKKAATTRKKAATSVKRAKAKPESEVHSTAENILGFLETKARNMDKLTIAKYTAVALLVIYGIRKSNVLGSLAVSVVTGVVSKFMADNMGQEGDLAKMIPGLSKS
jgi:hypothetical protein